MASKGKAAQIVMAFLPVVGQDPYTGITTAKECAKVAVKQIIDTKAKDQWMGAGEENDPAFWNEVLTDIDTF